MEANLAEMSTDEMKRRGQLIADVLKLKPLPGRGCDDQQYETQHGEKTSLGIFIMVNGIIQEGE